MDKHRLRLLYLPAGCLVCSGSLILSRYVPMSDFTAGLLPGAGIGLLLLFLVFQIKKKRRGREMQRG